MNADTYENFSKFPEIGGSTAFDDRTKTDQSADQIAFIKEQLKGFIKAESKRSAKKAVRKEFRKNRKKNKRKSVKWAKVVTFFKKMGDTLLKNLQKVMGNALSSGITTGITKIFNTLTSKLFHGRWCSIS